MKPDALSAARQSGFTMLEILVAIAIFVVVGALAMGGYNQLVRQSTIVEENAKRTREIQRTVQRVVQDFALLEPRPIRDPVGNTQQPALLADDRSQELVELTHSGWANPAGVSRSTLQRVRYRLEDDKLYRDYWVVLDRTLTSEPVSTVLLDRVRAAGFRYLTTQQTWSDQWPPLNTNAQTVGQNVAQQLPIAVEITLELEDWGKIVRLVEVAG